MRRILYNIIKDIICPFFIVLFAAIILRYFTYNIRAFILIYCFSSICFLSYVIMLYLSKKESLSIYLRSRLNRSCIKPLLLLLISNPIITIIIGKIGFTPNSQFVQINDFSLPSTTIVYFTICLFLTVPILVFAEELYFRCYLFDIQYKTFKKHTWVFNGLAWSIYHLFNPKLLIIIPISFLYSYVFQKYRNIWITFIAHLISNVFSELLIIYFMILKYL